jgi:polar amino acid transport system substrate-binding protein
MSMSYGPGRYDRRYEELGLDYPISYVRWTENRNMQAFIALASAGDVDPGKLDVQSVPFQEAEKSYEELARGERKSLAIVFRYQDEIDASRSLKLESVERKAKDELGVAFIGAGNYAKGLLLPAIGTAKRARRSWIVTATGPSARRTAEKFGYSSCGTDPAEALADNDVDIVFIATQHDSHAALAEEAIRRGKSVWLEKPPGITPEQVKGLIGAVRETGGFLSVGYNRRFSPHARAVKQAFASRDAPLAIRYTVAAGATPQGSWITDPRVGGGRVIGEVCHFVDLCLYLVGELPIRVYAQAVGRNSEVDDSIVSLISFPDGSTATIEYLASASADLPKERWELSSGGRTATCDNFRVTRVLGGAT